MQLCFLYACKVVRAHGSWIAFWHAARVKFGVFLKSRGKLLILEGFIFAKVSWKMAVLEGIIFAKVSWKTLVLEGIIIFSVLAKVARFGSVDSHLFEKSRGKTFVLEFEAWILTFCKSLLENARFGGVDFHFL